ncbi:MAG TPA: hypothetical protein VJ861_12575 [Treponemataceae bacterium]|nr:hypothetical protein [Treponemataceae bacterium]
MKYIKNHYWIIIVALIAIVCVILYANRKPNPSVVIGEYDVSKLSADFHKKGNPAYDIGVNAYGAPIFKNLDAALTAIQKDYPEGFAAIMEEFKLGPVSKSNYSWYKTYGWQLTTTDKNIQKQGSEISKFFDIFESSFFYDTPTTIPPAKNYALNSFCLDI